MSEDTGSSESQGVSCLNSSPGWLPQEKFDIIPKGLLSVPKVQQDQVLTGPRNPTFFLKLIFQSQETQIGTTSSKDY